MNKQFTLPKKFAVTWTKALRSKKFKQGRRALVSFQGDAPTVEMTDFCCLGVAGHLCGNSILDLSQKNYLLVRTTKNIPVEILGSSTRNKLVSILSTLNDGITQDDFKRLSKKYIFRPNISNMFNSIKAHIIVPISFKDIANFIEDNCEFTE